MTNIATNGPLSKEELLKVLTDAKSLIEQYGWCKGLYASDDKGNALPISVKECRHCIMGAIKFALGQTAWFIIEVEEQYTKKFQAENEIYNELYLSLNTLNVDKTISPILYNDDESTKKEDIIKLLDVTIDRIENEAER